MSIAGELESFTVAAGPVCKTTTLDEDDLRDLREAIASPSQHSVVARWWNATREEKTGVRLVPEWVARHRRKECVTCQ